MSCRPTPTDAGLGLLLVAATLLAGLLALLAVPVAPGGGSFGFADAGRGVAPGPCADVARTVLPARLEGGRAVLPPTAALAPRPADAGSTAVPGGSTHTGLAPLRV